MGWQALWSSVLWAGQAEVEGWGRWIQHGQLWGGTAAGSLGGSELYLTQVLP